MQINWASGLIDQILLQQNVLYSLLNMTSLREKIL